MIVVLLNFTITVGVFFLTFTIAKQLATSNRYLILLRYSNFTLTTWNTLKYSAIHTIAYGIPEIRISAYLGLLELQGQMLMWKFIEIDMLVSITQISK